MSTNRRYDLTTREGAQVRAEETTRRRIPPRYRDAVPGNLVVADWADALIGAWRSQRPEDARSLLITGPTGAGKTWEAYGAIRRIAAAGVVVGWQAATAPDLYAALRPGGSADAEAEYARWAGCPLLLLDDLGAAKDSEWTEEITYRLVNHRSANMLPTVITTNLPVRSSRPDQPSLRSAVSERVFSRLAEYQVVTLRGADRRLGMVTQ